MLELPDAEEDEEIVEVAVIVFAPVPITFSLSGGAASKVSAVVSRQSGRPSTSPQHAQISPLPVWVTSGGRPLQ